MPQDGVEKKWVLVDEEWVNEDYTHKSGTAPVKIANRRAGRTNIPQLKR
jgi:hypothetical protein